MNEEKNIYPSVNFVIYQAYINLLNIINILYRYIVVYHFDFAFEEQFLCTRPTSRMRPAELGQMNINVNSIVHTLKKTFIIGRFLKNSLV